MIVAADFFTTEVWTSKGLTRYLVLFFTELSTRKVAIAGIAWRAIGLWMSQVGRHVTDAVDGILNETSEVGQVQLPKAASKAIRSFNRPRRIADQVYH